MSRDGARDSACVELAACHAYDAGQRGVVSAGTVLGIGLGGFFDGILFHQILQLHNMLSARVPVRGLDAKTLVVNLEINMFWDGLFHAFTWCVTVLGLWMLWRAVHQQLVVLSGTAFVGALALGWGLFNLVEGILDHHVLHLHHVTETKDHLLWDILFLTSGLVLVLGGWMGIRAGRRNAVRIVSEPRGEPSDRQRAGLANAAPP